MATNEEIQEAQKEADEHNKKTSEIMDKLMSENDKYGQNIEVINIHNHFGGNQYYGTDGSGTGVLGTITKIGKAIVGNPLLSTASIGLMYAGSKLIKEGIGTEQRLRLGSSKTKIQREETKLLESKIASQNYSAYTSKSVFSTHGFTVKSNVDNEKDIFFEIFSASELPIIENYLNKKNLNEVTFNKLPDEDSFVKLLKDLVKCKFHRLIYIENEKYYNLYVNGDLQKEYKITFEKEGVNK